MKPHVVKHNPGEHKVRPRCPHGWSGKFLFIVAWGSLIFGGWSLLPLLLLTTKLADYERAGAGLVALFIALPALLLALGLFAALQWRKTWASTLGSVGLKTALGSFLMGLGLYLFGRW